MVGGMAQVIKHLPSKCEALHLISSTTHKKIKSWIQILKSVFNLWKQKFTLVK
jgi:hypothetical protein